MTPAPVLIIVVAIILLLIFYRCRDNFLRAYGLFFLILLVFASNKEYYGISTTLSEGILSPLSLVRWALLCVLIWHTMKLQRPPTFKIDAMLGASVVLLLIDMLISSVYAPSFGYTFMRALSFALLAFVVARGLTFYFFSSVNCLHFFRLKYYAAWIVLAPILIMFLTGVDYGVMLIGWQYAGLFGNQNMFGTFSALTTPFVLFHWRAVAQTRREKCLDLVLLAIILLGLYYSRSRNGMTTCLIAIGIFYFVINLQSRIRMVSAGICLMAALAISPAMNTDLTSFIRKGIDRSPHVTDFSSQLAEERRTEIWTGVWPIFWKEKLTGYGFASSHLFVFPFTQDKEVGRTVHNSYLEIFGDLGLPGLIILLILLFRVSVKLFVLIQQQGVLLERNINAVFISVFIAGSANAFLESWMFSVGNILSLIYWGSVAGIVARWAWRPAMVRQTHETVEMKPGLRYTAVRPQH